MLGAKESPIVGNANYGFEVVGAASASVAMVLIGTRYSSPIDLSVIGVTGSKLRVDSIVSLQGITTAGNQQSGDGTLAVSLPIPNTPSLAGIRFDAQAAIVDLLNGRMVPITLTNGLAVAIH